MIEFRQTSSFSYSCCCFRASEVLTDERYKEKMPEIFSLVQMCMYHKRKLVRCQFEIQENYQQIFKNRNDGKYKETVKLYLML